MKNNLILIALFFISFGVAIAQSSSEWKAPMYEVNFTSDMGEEAKMEIDKGYQWSLIHI